MTVDWNPSRPGRIPKAMGPSEGVGALPRHRVSEFVQRFASAHGVVDCRIGLDDWAEAVMRAAGDDADLDATDTLPAALKKERVISGREMARLLSNHLNEVIDVR